jgi:hypothetical protein
LPQLRFSQFANPAAVKILLLVISLISQTQNLEIERKFPDVYEKLWDKVTGCFIPIYATMNALTHN